MTHLIKLFEIIIFFILTISVSTAASTKEPDTLIIGENHIEIKSGNNLDGYHDIILGKKLESQIITGKLYIPKMCGKEKIPAVIIQHGSGNPNKPWYKKLSMALNKIGIIALVPDSLSPRGLSATTRDQSKLSKATRLFDTFSAFRYLQSLRCVDAKRIGITGYSFGGIIAQDSVEKKLAEKLGNGHAYKASLPVYPSCQSNFENSMPTKTTVHILAGGADDYTPVKYCIESVKIKKSKGWDINITVLDGAHHGFNNEWAPKRFPKAWTFGGCGFFTIDDDGYELSNKHKTSTRNGWGKYVRTMAQKCGKKGVTMGGSKETAKKTLNFTVQFFKNNL